MKFESAYNRLKKFEMQSLGKDTWKVSKNKKNYVYLKNQNGHAIMIAMVFDGETMSAVHCNHTIKAMVSHLEGEK